ncbi:MAG TPA: tetratricopeptide repeat protein [Blastocatellia bacterium]|nr:tetratricopeptide repeat protein [Blastocatellia bacterium]
MSLLETIKGLTGKIGFGRYHTPRPTTGCECPHEAELLAYSLDRLPARRREQLESHFLGCDDCRDFLALFARNSYDATEHEIKPLADSDIKSQAARILTYIKEDEFKSSRRAGGRQPARSLGEGFFVSTRQLATVGLMVSALAVGTVYYVTKGEPEREVAMDALALATQEKRLTEARLSGDLPYSPYSFVTRTASSSEGEDPLAEVQFGSAQALLQFAEDASAPAEDRLVLARVYLSRNEADYTRRALAILEQLVAVENPSHEALNDIGVALLLLSRYAEAISYFDLALEKAPSYDEAFFNRALARRGLGDEVNAKEDFRRCIEVSDDEKWKGEAQRLMNKI